MDKILAGKKGEDLAVTFLRKTGYVILARNYRDSMGEVDIIAEENGALVFIEVKSRGSLRYGDPKEAITAHKKRQLSKTALAFMSKTGLSGQRARFDVVAIQFAGGRPQFELIKNAFDVSY
ncbi:MAG: YraN family protein [Thermodesulfobacteriota bacterium]